MIKKIILIFITLLLMGISGSANIATENAIHENSTGIYHVVVGQQYNNSNTLLITNLTGKYQDAIANLDTIINDPSMTDAEQQAYIKVLAQQQKMMFQLWRAAFWVIFR